MNKINVGEYGELMVMDLGIDVSSYTHTITIKDPDGNEADYTATVGTSDTETDIGTLTANQFIEWTIENVFDEAGRWSIRATGDTGSGIRKTDWHPIVVKA